VAGGGIEYAFKPNWTVKLEYDYSRVGHWTSSTVPAVGWNRDIQMITMGVNYKFGSGASGASGSPGHEKYQDTDEGKEKLRLCCGGNSSTRPYRAQESTEPVARQRRKIADRPLSLS
jgi:hypothetical protein